MRQIDIVKLYAPKRCLIIDDIPVWGCCGNFDYRRLIRDGGSLWLVELVAPFANEDNHHKEQILLDLKSTEFKGKTLSFRQYAQGRLSKVKLDC